ncbi:MAG: chorismate synthase [Clostridia bacterium]|nr:chorismate synthase [Clostridia bacterium]
MSNSMGKIYRIQIFGQSHSPMIGVVVEGLPAGVVPDMDAVRALMARRAPGGALSTARREADEPRIVSGLNDRGETCGSPLCALIENADPRPGDYEALRDVPRPGHADYTANVKFAGHNDIRGGGQFSGRLTAPLCFAGALALQMLNQQGIRVRARALRIADVEDAPIDPCDPPMSEFANGPVPCLDADAARRMAAAIEAARADGDSVGGVVECFATGLPAGIGEPMFDGVENRLAQALFAIPAVRGVEFGAGFAAASMHGSEHNDAFRVKNGAVVAETNRHGGVLGGVTSGMPLIVRAAFKPTPSIAKPQRSVSLSRGEDADLTVRGRHDPCVVPRAVPCVEAAVACALYDLLLESGLQGQTHKAR